MPNPGFVLGDGCADSGTFRVTSVDEVISISGAGLGTLWQSDPRGPLQGGMMLVELFLLSGGDGINAELRTLAYPSDWYSRDYFTYVGVNRSGYNLQSYDSIILRLACCNSATRLAVIGSGTGSFRIRATLIENAPENNNWVYPF